jgi:putative RNA 2'-phosphotransferase
LGRFLALVLRHKPDSVGVTLDPSGFVDVAALSAALAAQPGWTWVTEDVIRAAAQHDARRYELDADRIRARYGHSIPIAAPGKTVLPPEWLYHGTVPETLEKLHHEGLQPQGRQFVHLSATRQDALAVGKRHGTEAAVVTVLARQAQEAGLEFYLASPSIYLVKAVPPAYLIIPAGPEDS